MGNALATTSLYLLPYWKNQTTVFMMQGITLKP
jgi:hypothetical protein